MEHEIMLKRGHKESKKRGEKGQKEGKKRVKGGQREGKEAKKIEHELS